MEEQGYVVQLVGSDDRSQTYLFCVPGFSPCFRSREDATLFRSVEDAAAARERALRHVFYKAPETFSPGFHSRLLASKVVELAQLAPAISAALRFHPVAD